MNLVRLTDHNENIYDIKGERTFLFTKPPWYTSKFRSQVAQEVKILKNDHRTFGLPEVPRDKPSEFLKKHSRQNPPRPVVDEPRCLTSHRRPPVPPRPLPVKKTPDHEQPPISRNFCVENAIQIIRRVPRQPERLYAHTRSGDLQNLEASGLMPKFSLRKTYGKVPNYLKERFKEMEEIRWKEQNSKDRMVANTRYIPQTDREDLLNGMKKNLHDLMCLYNSLPVLIDTHAKIRRKLKLEADLKQLEQDIQTVERHPLIYVVDENAVANGV